MRVIIVRHGDAAPVAEGGHDADRPLVASGQGQAAWLGEALAKPSRRPVRVVSSPARRAKETAEAIGGALGVGVEFDERLAVDEPVSLALELIGEAVGGGGEPADGAAVCVVGHNPQLAHAVGALTVGAAGGGHLPLRRGEAVVVEVAAVDGSGGGGEVERLRRADVN